MCSGRFSKVSCMFSVVLVLASFSVSAFPGRKAPIAVEEETKSVAIGYIQQAQPEEPMQEPEAPVEALPEEPVSQETPSEKASAMTSEEASQQLKELSDSLNEKTILTGRSLEALRTTIDKIKSDTELMIADSQEMETKYIEALETNARQADDLAAIKESLKKEKSIKAFAKIGAVIGFKNNLPTWGISGAVGMRSGSGFLLEAGAQYMLGTFTSAPGLSFSLDSLAITCSVGWEW